MDEATIEKMIKLSHSVKKNAYCPYSNFPVGCVLLSQDGTIFTGVNMENASLGSSICAERTALGSAISQGHRKFTACFVSSNMEEDYILPCGPCRQVLGEFGVDCQVYCTKPDFSYKMMTIDELLPLSFGPCTMPFLTKTLNNKK